MFAYGELAIDVGVCAVFVKPRFISEEIRSTSDDCGEALNVSRARKTGGCVLREKNVFGTQASGDQKKFLNSFALNCRKSATKAKT